MVPSLVGGYFAFFQSLWHSILIQSQTGAAVDIFQSHGKHDGMGIAWIRQRRCQNVRSCVTLLAMVDYDMYSSSSGAAFVRESFKFKAKTSNNGSP